MSNASVEVTAKTLEEAQSLAAEQLGVEVAEVEYEVTSEPKKLLGVLGSGQYTLRAWIAGSPPEAAEAVAAPAAPEAEAADAGVPPTAEEVADRAGMVAGHILELMGVNAEITIDSSSREGIRIHIASPESEALLIGRHGETLDALQFLVGIGANQGEHGGYRVTLDVGDYRERQEEKLRQMAIEMADEAVANGEEAVLSLSAYERRIVHMTLKDRPDVETYSEGEGEQRQLVISPLVAPPAAEAEAEAEAEE
ncbi:MAG TPA: RNA-binding cell elongation regulator Jag/EloR [Armatimonadota bacterium]|jgi:spoIIIJ-associated protein